MKKNIVKTKKLSVVNRLVGSLNYLVPKAKLKVPTEKAIEKAMEIMAKEIARKWLITMLHFMMYVRQKV